MNHLPQSPEGRGASSRAARAALRRKPRRTFLPAPSSRLVGGYPKHSTLRNTPNEPFATVSRGEGGVLACRESGTTAKAPADLPPSSQLPARRGLPKTQYLEEHA